MGQDSKIQWTDDTWNPWRGCTKVSPGCKNCYAETLVMRRMKGGAYRKGVPRVRHTAATFDAPLRWHKKPWVCDECGHASGGQFDECECGGVGSGVVKRHRRRVFALSLGDWLDDEVPVEWLGDMLTVIERCPNLDFLLLTKRPRNFQSRMKLVDRNAQQQSAADLAVRWLEGEPPDNVWFGFSAENQEWFDARWAVARNIPARQLFVSFEPLLGPIVVSEDFWGNIQHSTFNAQHRTGKPWGIIGGESGLKARACRAEWIGGLHAQFTWRKCPVFVKQMGSNVWSDTDDFNCAMSDLGERGVQWKAHLRDPHGSDPAEWPDDLRVRQWPDRAETFNAQPSTPNTEVKTT